MRKVIGERFMRAAGRYAELEFPVVSETIVHQRYLTLFNRRIRFPAVGTRPVRSGGAAVDEVLCSSRSLSWGVNHSIYVPENDAPSVRSSQTGLQCHLVGDGTSGCLLCLRVHRDSPGTREGLNTAGQAR